MTLLKTHPDSPQHAEYVAALLTENQRLREALLANTPHLAKMEELHVHNLQLREALQRSIPWLCKGLAENLHVNCAAPNDLNATIEQAQAALASGKECAK